MSLTDFLILIYEFFKTGLFAVGGGLATIPFLKEIAEKYQWFTVSELTDMIAISESTPGPIGVNMATYSGFNMGMGSGKLLPALLGGVFATLSLVAPSVIIILIVYKFLEKFKTNKLVEGAFYGIRPCSASLVAAAILDVLLLSTVTALPEAKTLFGVIPVNFEIDYIAIAFFALMIPLVIKFKKVHPAVFIVIGATFGIILKL